VWKAYGGFIGVETMLPLMLTAAAQGKLTVEDIVRLCSYTPATRWSMATKGQLAPGFDADFVLVDPTAGVVLDQTSLHSKHNVTPYDGWHLTGKVLATTCGADRSMRRATSSACRRAVRWHPSADRWPHPDERLPGNGPQRRR